MSSPKPPAATSSDSGGVILIVEDEPSLRESIAYHLKSEGYTVETAADGVRALGIARERKPDLVLLDIMLPGMNGLQVCRALRDELNTIVIMLSAKGDELDRVLGLELGADDYLAKPFAMRELVAHVRAMLRRSRMARAESAPPNGLDTENAAAASGERQLIHAGDVEIDVPRRQVSLGGASLSLKPKEFDLLVYFARHPGIVLSRDALLREVWGYDYPVDTRTVDVHVRWLRQKIETEPSAPIRIETMRGHGYRFVTHES